ncbi:MULTISPECIES: 3-methyl-2-oxobutanoate hydroxymethyltransferase [unclassified Polaromonas]|jgi:3-methyl-2-oxobutanoate hydroxymethyltransferase|uniref:3-methyl-2-oxobutanoate hydroxymethyltransferase n=1 Tax=unclassified Polaromonas TaxID=2638319 RepID=UPI000BD871AF|nr:MULTISPECIES: 3-methyl-2-oxobutanoate hydroxymethyltransferase [unclassified Polaromonas]OYY35993.1 MAG: 3-methyl-2-oxobutanoate hydroxymethyltransferase [Polaromonas sp. 35-63-35]OYZ19702.1 MAG: 3-methyl-2-oxobutanoate hydroxymethyltransferase [Polaromonas sp. 16-63-31]OYZ80031.1 MAG: 3-methyl-2-oxobutanoate hydroxymethyltransferase [Polaromonas sp. 24-63-21]OZA52148.1 MAG: 3-methyl-2-oxobutanoate hydroxymethyltransferase [Polaromonas sp. 17-63-33]OZA87820.1 MAG: 3-methyl-2-oxobutanoate hy
MTQAPAHPPAAGSTSPYGTLPAAPPPAVRKPVSLPRLREMHAQGEKITMLTAYDATFAAVADAAGVECLLVGDSLGMVCQGLSSTVGVTLETMRYHTECVARGLRRAQATAWLIGDLPFGSYHESKEQALRSAVVLMQAGAHMVKLEGGGWTTETVHFLVERGIPVCAHLGLTPQTVHALGGYRVQGRGDEAAATLTSQAHALQDAGASMLVLEMVPAALSAALTKELTHCATIGIGAGVGTAGQVLVLHDMLGMNLGKMPKFVHNFMAEAHSVQGAMQAYVQAVKQQRFPVDALHAW